MDTKLTRAESEIMNYIWDLNSGATFGSILSYFQNDGERGWKKQTLNTYLRKLIDKELISTEKIGTKLYYSPSLNKESFGAIKTCEIIDEYYGGSVQKFFTALSNSTSLGEQKAKELSDILLRKE